MKRLSNLFAALVFASLVIFMSCGSDGPDDPELSAAQQAAIDLADGTWSVDATNVTLNNNVQDFDWTGFQVTFSLSSEGATSGSYSSNVNTVTPVDNSGDGRDATALWATSGGEWSVGTNGTTLTKDGIAVDIDVLSATNLTVSFTVPDPGGRTSGVFGEEWIFPFSK